MCARVVVVMCELCLRWWRCVGVVVVCKALVLVCKGLVVRGNYPIQLNIADLGSLAVEVASASPVHTRGIC